ncbi:protein PRRC2C isoform X5 [Leptopilina boulardi]|uniref:protein PRRC2C isoform X5 n=1 Tax=Leptopilina boulardi TaxID=63433 RepID=UPI0021F5154C|nr:protein PRRC2C isoform X5 [Leptopilina boulardi]
MSTLSGIVSKGEKGKSKFQSLDINSLYRVSRGESLEQQQQKSTLPRKHGMQSLGKVPSARRPPANLPSLKSEHSSSDPAVSLVPSGGSGWATTKEVSSSTNTTTTTANTLDSNNTNSSQSQCVTGTSPSSTVTQHPPLPGQQNSSSPHPSDVGNKSSWSAIMSRPGDVGGGIAGQQQQQSQQNRELNAQYGPGPSLRPQTEGSWIQGGSRAAGGVGTVATGPGNGNTQVAQGPLINIVCPPGHTEGPNGGRPNLAQSPGMAMGQAGPPNNQSSIPSGPHQVGPNVHHYRGIIPPFMYRGSFPQGGFPSQFTGNIGPGGPRPRFNYPPERFTNAQRQQLQQQQQQQQERDRQNPPDDEQLVTRPIIKEEDLTKMDDISRDAGWAAHDVIDYNQKLAFSDDELDAEPIKDDKKEIKEEKNDEILIDERDNNKLRDNRDLKENREQPPLRTWNQNTSPRDFRGSSNQSTTSGYSSQQQHRSNHSLRGVEEEEIWNQRRREQGERVASAVERARQRKEEEEKRYQEQTKQAAAKKLQNLEQKLKEKQAKQKDDESSETKVVITTVPPVSIPVPEWERDKENRDRESQERSRTSSEGKEEKRDSRGGGGVVVVVGSGGGGGVEQVSSEFRERASFIRQQVDNNREQRERERDRDRDQREMRERDPPAFSRHFQHNLPPRFQKQQAERSGVSGTAYNRVSPNAERNITSQSVITYSQQIEPNRWVPNHNNSLTDPMKMSQPQRRSKDSDVTSPMDEERPPSRDHRGPHLSRDERYRHSSHRSYDNRKPGYYDDYTRGYKDYEYDDRHSRDSWERDRHYDDKDNRESRDMRDREPRERDNRHGDRDIRDKKDYDPHMKVSSADSFDERDNQRERTESNEWRGDDRRDIHDDRNLQERSSSFDNRRNIPRDDRSERSERPQRPDSRDSRTSRESRTSLRDEDFHKSRDSGSWINDLSDYEESKKSDIIFRDDIRERDRRQPPGPVTREKLEADELKSEKRCLTQLKRGSIEQEKKIDTLKELTVDGKKETEVWNNRKLERTSETSKVWADAVSPTFEKEEEKIELKEDKIVGDLKQSMEKLSVDKREDVIEESKDDNKDDKREKSSRNRANSGSSRGRETRGRQWGGFNVYNQRWRGSETRGRRGGSRISGRPGSARSGSYGHTDSEISGDEISSSAELPKDERRAKSPKSFQKGEKEDRNREMSRRDDKRNDYSQIRQDNKRPGYDGRQGFAPSGEPSRRGRGGYRLRGTTTGGRMEGYGPPSSKSPFSSERSMDEKNVGQQNPITTTTTTTENDANNGGNLESTDDKTIAKQQALTAGITGRHTKSPNQQIKQENHTNATSRNQSRKDERPKRNHSGNRKTRDMNRETRFRGVVGQTGGNNISKQNSSDIGNEDWETTSENSDEHIDDRKDSRNNRKPFSRGGANLGSQSRRNDQLGNNRDQRDKNSKSSSGASSRAPGAEKRNVQNTAFNNQRNNSSNIPPLMQNVQTQNGRPRSQGSANVQLKSLNKESTVNRVDEIKLNDPNLVNQALNDINKKSISKDKKPNDGESDTNNYSTGGDDGVNSTEDKIDSDGFQEVRSKKNVKDSRHNLKDDNKTITTSSSSSSITTSTRRDKEKERERERSKSKSNGPQPTPQQVQKIPTLLGQPILPPANMPQKSFDRNASRQKLAPRFQKQRLAKQQQQLGSDNEGKSNNYIKDSSSGGPAPPPSVNAWDKPFTSQLRANSPSGVTTDIQLISGLSTQTDHVHEANEQTTSGGSSQRNSPNCDKKINKDIDKNVTDTSSPPVQTLIFENTNYSKTTKTNSSDLAMKSKYSNHMKTQSRIDKRDIDDDGNQIQQQQQQQALSAAFSTKPGDIIKEKNQEPIQMPLSFNKSEDNADMKLDFTFDSDLSQLTEDKSKSLGITRSIHITGGQSSSTAELNLKIASVKKVWENAPPMPTVVEHEDGNVVNNANSFPQAFVENNDDDNYSHQQYNQNNMKNEIATSTNVCKLVPPQVKPQQQTSGGSAAQSGSSVQGPSPIGPGQSPIGHPPVSLQGPLSPPPFNSTGQPSHINYQEFPQYPGSQAAQYGSMSAIPSPPAMLYNTGSGQLPAQAGGLYGAFQLDQSRSPFTQYPPYAPSLQSSFNQQNVYLQQAPPHAPNAPAPDMYQSNLSQYRITTAAAPPFGQNQQLSNNPNTVLISSSSNSLMSASVKPSSQSIGAIGTKAQHFQAQSAPQPNQLAYIPYDPNQVLGVSGSYMGNSQLVQRPGPNVQPSANSYYSATSADVFPGSQTGFYQPGGGAQQTGTHYGLQGFGQHSQSLATGNAAPVGLQNFSSQFLSSSGLQLAAQGYRNPTGGLPGPANAAATFLSKHQQQEQPRQLKSPSGNQQDVLTSVFGSTPQIPSPKSRKQQTSSQQPQPSPTQHHKYQQYQGVSQSALVSSYTNYVLQQNVRGMGMPPPPRAGLQSSQQRYPPPIQRPVVPFPPGPNNPSQQQQNCMTNPQQQQQSQINRHRTNIHQQQRNMKMQQQYYSGSGNVKMDSSDKVDSHNDKIAENNTGNQSGNNKSNINQQDSDNKEEVNQQNE